MSKSEDIERAQGCMGCIIIIIYIILGIGWIMNFVKFVKCDFKEPYKAEIVRGIGIPAVPMGGIIGWINIDDTPKEVEKE